MPIPPFLGTGNTNVNTSVIEQSTRYTEKFKQQRESKDTLKIDYMKNNKNKRYCNKYV